MNPKRLAVLLVLVGLSAPLNAGADADKKDVQLDFEGRLYRVMERLSGETALDESIWAGTESPTLEQKKSLTLFTSAKFQVGKDRLEIGNKGWFWNGESMDSTDVTTRTQALWESIHSIAIMAWPKVRLTNGVLIDYAARSNQRLEYFERRNDGLFELTGVDEPTGLSIKTIATLENNDRVKLDLTVSLRTVDKREPIPDVMLQVGRPILHSTEHKAELLVRAGKEYGILLHAGDEGQGVLIFRLRLGIAKPAAGSGEKTPAGS